MNKCILLGNLCKEPELRQTQSGTAVCNFSIAVRRRFIKDGQPDADFINCTAWQNTAEFICKYFHKGSPIAVVGELRSESWENQEGKRQYSVSVNVDEAHFAGVNNR